MFVYLGVDTVPAISEADIPTRSPASHSLLVVTRVVIPAEKSTTAGCASCLPSSSLRILSSSSLLHAVKVNVSVVKANIKSVKVNFRELKVNFDKIRVDSFVFMIFVLFSISILLFSVNSSSLLCCSLVYCPHKSLMTSNSFVSRKSGWYMLRYH